MSKKQTNTQIINNLLTKIDKVSDISDSVKENAFRKKPGEKGVSFKFANKVMENEEVNLRHKLLNFKEWDLVLFDKLDVNVYFTENMTSRNAGTYSHSGIRMNRKYNLSLWPTFVHEVGHAHMFQLGIEYIPDERKVRLKLIKKLLEDLSGEIISTNSFTKLKPYLKEYISWYAPKNEDEAFAEIFMKAYSSSNKELKKYCAQMINEYNKEIYKGLNSK